MGASVLEDSCEGLPLVVLLHPSREGGQAKEEESAALMRRELRAVAPRHGANVGARGGSGDDLERVALLSRPR